MGKLTPIEYENQRILTTKQLAEAYGANEQQIQQNFSNNKGNFEEGKHYYFLECDKLKEFKRHFDDIEEAIGISKFVSNIYLWTHRGASRHCKILETDKAWEQFDKLEESYFRKQDQLKLAQPYDTTKAFSIGEVTNFLKTTVSVMKLQNSPRYKIAEQYQLTCEQFGIKVINDFVEPIFEQLSLVSMNK